MTHLFERYLQAHGHYPRARQSIGGGKFVEIYVTPTYACISTKPSGGQTYIPRNELVTILKWLIPLVRQMDESFSVEQAIQDYNAAETAHLQALRQLKRRRR